MRSKEGIRLQASGVRQIPGPDKRLADLQCLQVHDRNFSGPEISEEGRKVVQ